MCGIEARASVAQAADYVNPASTRRYFVSGIRVTFT
jgi:hypothetical protein